MNYSSLFKQGLKANNIDMIKRVHKGDVHSHCGLAMRFDEFNKWAGGDVQRPPATMDGIEGLDDYIFNVTIPYIKTVNDLRFIIEGAIKEAIRDGVTVLEASVDCHETLRFDDENGLFKMLTDIKNTHKDVIDFRPELGMAKSISEENMDKLVVKCIDSGLYKSIDIYGNEMFQDFDRFKEQYKYAKSKGLKLKAHAGEFYGSDNVRKAIESLELDELQHGIGAANDEYLMDLIKERDIRLNVCPSSNIILGAVDDIKKHPIRVLFDKGIRITVNTDDLLLFDMGVSQEYLYLYNNGVLNADELDIIRKNSLTEK